LFNIPKDFLKIKGKFYLIKIPPAFFFWFINIVIVLYWRFEVYFLKEKVFFRKKVLQIKKKNISKEICTIFLKSLKFKLRWHLIESVLNKKKNKIDLFYLNFHFFWNYWTRKITYVSARLFFLFCSGLCNQRFLCCARSTR
jgi:hypothetical protein